MRIKNAMKKIYICFLFYIVILFYPSFGYASSLNTNTESEKTWTINLGIGDVKAWNYAGISKEFIINKNTAFFLTGGIGTILAGAGISYYANRNGNGIVCAGTIGIVGIHANLAYQFILNEHNF
ncbi:hypothetical protein HY745_03595 [Candidatus Desantisbacteria bacterium]|nr:hypothetical protein [Candidatus Desantisbacteria bacterium]